MRAAIVVLFTCFLCAGCGAHSWRLGPAPLAQPRPYTALERMRAHPPVDVTRVAETPAQDDPRTPPPPRVRPEPLEPAPSPPNTSDAPEVFACADGSRLELAMSANGERATARWDDGATLELDRVAGAGPLAYASSDGGTELRRAGPRLALSRAQPATEVTVAAGDTLSAIALRHYGSFDQVDAIVRANAGLIDDPNLIFPGQVFVLPGVETGDEASPPARALAAQTACRRTLAGTPT